MSGHKVRYVVKFKDIPTQRVRIPELPVEERIKNFSEVELGYTQEQAFVEAARCLSCRRCIGCGMCLAVCKRKAIDYTQVDVDIELEAEAIIISPGVERIPSCADAKFGYGKYINVITSQEFERILSDDGPYKGLVLRPYDGEIPRKIAFVPGDAQHDTHTLSYAIRVALAAQRKLQDLESCLFFSDGVIHKNEVETYHNKESKISFRSGEVVSISENEDNRNLIIEFARSKKLQKEEFQLVVLLTTSELPQDIKELTKQMSVDLASYNLQGTADTSLVQTAKEGLFVTGLAFTVETENVNS
jgi:heterodisulfide reductase subunit A-like polyferredoxin